MEQQRIMTTEEITFIIIAAIAVVCIGLSIRYDEW